MSVRLRLRLAVMLLGACLSDGCLLDQPLFVGSKTDIEARRSRGIWRLHHRRALFFCSLSRMGRFDGDGGVHVGSAPLSAALWNDIRKWTGTQNVCNAYGITETGSWVAGLDKADVPAEDGLIGHGWGAVVKVLNTDETAHPLGPDNQCKTGEEGYVWVNTPALMKGYFRRDDLTAKAVVAGWFMTGDIGFLDDHGRLLLRGRERDEINKGGMKIYPSDIEAVVERYPATNDVCAFALEDQIYGQAVGMAVVLNDTKDDTVSGLYRWMKTHLAEHKMPSRWWVTDAIPRTSRGKINRAAVRAACAQKPALDLSSILARRPGA